MTSCATLPTKWAQDYARTENDVASLEAEADKALLAENSRVAESSKGFGQRVSPVGQSRAIDVYYATTRRRSGRTEVNRFYGVDRIRKPAVAEYGIVTVHIPPVHRKASLERPWSVFTLELKESVEKHMMLLSVRPMTKELLLHELNMAVHEQGTLFVYVHGYYNSFSDAARKAAQIAVDLDIAVPVMFSWASRDTFWGYFDDQESSRDASDYLATFLEDLRERTTATKIHLVAHSMGSDVLAQALKTIASRHEGTLVYRFSETVLAAPDVDAGVFSSAVDLAKLISDRVTTYVSSSDLAMRASHFFRKGSYRAGDSEPQPVVIDGVDTVDVSSVSDDWLGHDYVTANWSVLRDLASVFHGTQADKRGLTAAFTIEKARYWIFGPGSGTEPEGRGARSLVAASK